MSLRTTDDIVTPYGEYLLVHKHPRKPERKTDIFTVTSKDPTNELGIVKWFGSWRKYCFFPYPNTVFDSACLQNIAHFCATETRTHRDKP